MYILLPEEGSVEVEKAEEKLRRAQLLEPPMEVMQFKVIPCALR